jgi:Domain of unknown function (DUF4349)
MTPSPELIHELKASRPAAPAALRARVRELAAQESPAPAPRAVSRFRLPIRRISLVALPAAAALAVVTAGAVGLARSDGDPAQAIALESEDATTKAFDAADGERAQSQPAPSPLNLGAADPVAPASGRVQQVTATLTVEVDDSDGVSNASQEALDLTRRLGGHVVSASVTTGDQAGAELTVRVPVAKAQEAVAGLSALGAIVSQQVRFDDLQEPIDAFERRQRSLRNQIAVVQARLDGSLDAETRARLEERLKNLRADLRGARRNEAGLRAQGRMATIALSVVTSETQGGAAPASRLERTLDEALNVLVWEGVIVLAIAIVAAPFALVALAAWLGRRLYRRREEERLLAT